MGACSADNRHVISDKYYLVFPTAAREHGQQVVDVQPCFVAVLAEERVQNACYLGPYSLPPVRVVLGSEMADYIAVKLLTHREKQASMFLRGDFDRFTRCFKVK